MGSDSTLSSLQSPSLCENCGVIKSAFMCVCMNFLKSCYETSLRHHVIGNIQNSNTQVFHGGEFSYCVLLGYGTLFLSLILCSQRY
jgi:hypothetical protein